MRPFTTTFAIIIILRSFGGVKSNAYFLHGNNYVKNVNLMYGFISGYIMLRILAFYNHHPPLLAPDQEQRDSKKSVEG